MTDHILDRIFQEDPKKRRNPNDPLNSAYFNERTKIVNQALATWHMEFGGIEAIRQMEEGIRASVRMALNANLTSTEGKDEAIIYLRDAQSQIHFISIIEDATEKEQKRQDELKQQ